VVAVASVIRVLMLLALVTVLAGHAVSLEREATVIDFTLKWWKFCHSRFQSTYSSAFTLKLATSFKEHIYVEIL